MAKHREPAEEPSGQPTSDAAESSSADAETTEHAVDPGYSLTELAEASGVTERTIRYYQSEKLIPKPAKRGRERRYDADHLERLGLIVDLRDRGLTLQTIRDLVDNDDPTRTVASWLGIDATLRVPWSQDRPRTLSLEELRELVDDPTPGLLAELHDAGYTRSNDDGTWTVPSPALLGLALGLRAAGMEVQIAGYIRDVVRKRVAKAVDEIVDHLVDRWADGGSEVERDQLVSALSTLRPVAGEMTALVLAQEVERALGDLVTTRARDLTRVDRRA